MGFISPINWTFASGQVSIVRFPISRGADLHHLSDRGFSPAMFLFGFKPSQSQRSEPTPRAVLLELLSAASFNKFNLQDAMRWSSMHRAARFCNAEDIKMLIQRHASVDLVTVPPSWTPIFVAVYFRNFETFNELRKYQVNLLTMTDARKWTLLHVAVDAQRLDMTQLLIDLSTDPHSRSLAKQFSVAEDLRVLSVTPGEIARLRGPGVLSVYLDALRKRGNDVEVVKGERGDGDLFWPASD